MPGSPHFSGASVLRVCAQSPVLPTLALEELPTMQSRNFAARAGRWSAQHRKKAILGWFAFVILATVLGGMVGTKSLADEDTGNGESRRGDQIIEAADFPEQSGETILVQGRDGLAVGDAKFTAAVD